MNLYEYDYPEMQCYCQTCACKNTRDYVYPYNWGSTDDYLCHDCLEREHE